MTTTYLQRMAQGAVCLTVMVLAVPRTAMAHALLMHSTPAAHGVVHDRSLPIELDYNSRVDGSRSRLTLTAKQDAGARPIALQPLVQTAPQVLKSAAAVPLAPGGYTLHWIVLAADGHISRGEIVFTVE